jgi:hypothetical protein
MALLASVGGKSLMGRADNFTQAPGFTVGLDGQIFRSKTGVAFNTEFAFMAVGTELRISTCCYGMRHMELRPVNIDHIVTQFTHFIGKTCLVAIQAV